MDVGDEEENEAQETRRKELEEGIYKAVCDNNIEKLLEMVEKGADIDTIFEDYSGVSTKSLLHVCCEKGRIECAKVLLDLGACVNLRDSWGQNSLMCCMITQYQDIAQLLLDKDQIIVNHQDRYGKTPLHCAVESGSLDSVRLLLRYDVDVCRHTAEGVTAVMLAVTLRDDEDVTATMIQLMIDAGYDLEMKDFRSKRTALQMAVVAKNPRFVDLLLSSGADVNTLDVAFRTPLTNAVYHHARKPPGKTTCVVDATGMAIIRSLTQAKCDLNMTLVEHCNPLIAAAIVDSAELTQFFLENGSNIDTQFHATGSTALTVSVSRHSVASFLTLLRWNCDLEPRTHIQKKRRDYYLNAFELAVFLGHMDMAEILVKVGCDLQHIAYLKDILGEDCIPEGLNKDLEMLSWMRISANNPRSLVDSCVLIVRRQLHWSVMSKATVLPLPTKVRQFVAMSNILSPPD